MLPGTEFQDVAPSENNGEEEEPGSSIVRFPINKSRFFVWRTLLCPGCHIQEARKEDPLCRPLCRRALNWENVPRKVRNRFEMLHGASVDEFRITIINNKEASGILMPSRKNKVSKVGIIRDGATPPLSSHLK